jgi:hypothetical protein
MGKAYNNPIFQYLFILYLCIALLMAQASGLHMHVQHDDHSSATSGHIIDIHIASTLHDIDTHHHEAQGGHHAVAIDVSQDYLVKKTNLFNQLALFVFFIGVLLFTPRLGCVFSRWRYKTSSVIHCCYLFLPPLRAPPVN